MPRLGRVFIAPHTYRASVRYYQRAYGNGMAICREFGNPHLLITYTMNSKCPELEMMMLGGQTFADRPDLVGRLFIDKEKEFINDLSHNKVLGPVKAWFGVVEHQKL